VSQSADWIVFLQSFNWETAARIAVAAVLGAIVGLERVWGGHPAGLRTNMLISISSCLFTILSIEGFPLHGTAQDTGRVAAQIVTGVGFLGAGAVLQTRHHVRGLTTAATIWLVAAIGMAAGTGGYFLAVFTTFLSTLLLVLLAPISSRLERRALEKSKKQREARGNGELRGEEEQGEEEQGEDQFMD
jgi:putative Mg2+ transporter-C (MgtC) family protein